MGASQKPAQPGQPTPPDGTQPTAVPDTTGHSPRNGTTIPPAPGPAPSQPPDGTPPTILRGSTSPTPQPRKSLFRK
ncbi:hypothetical protein MSKU9_0214 [Komagataeibacter diospyri]|uniref:Uncharacterized protein n=1 Tax=Komagataeibacter diospyri TaxID=1932662 RepID=A0A4P5NL36_9PROT|nr:hypothetical protein MSKU9_0214 [Komagataeibacter diospyri]